MRHLHLLVERHLGSNCSADSLELTAKVYEMNRRIYGKLTAPLQYIPASSLSGNGKSDKLTAVLVPTFIDGIDRDPNNVSRGTGLDIVRYCK